MSEADGAYGEEVAARSDHVITRRATRPEAAAVEPAFEAAHATGHHGRAAHARFAVFTPKQWPPGTPAPNGKHVGPEFRRFLSAG